MRTRTDNSREPAHPARRRRTWRRVLTVLLILAIGLGVIRALLPYYIERHVNRVLDRSDKFDGFIDGVDLHLYRGAYSIDGIEIVKVERSVPVPFFAARRVEASVDWSSLLHGVARGKLTIERPSLNFVDGASRDDTQTGENEPWLGMIRELFPFDIEEAEIIDGEMHFRAFHMEPEVNVYLTDLDATVTNLTNVEDSLETKVATVKATAVAMNSGRLELEMTVDPFSYRPTFDLAAKLLELQVTELDSLTRAYGEFDFEGGEFDLIVEATAENGFLDGYAKPLFRNLVVLSRSDLNNDDPLQVFWEALVGVVEELFQNQPRDQFGTLLSIEGALDNPRTNILEIVSNILYNAFIRAYLPNFEGGLAPEVSLRVEAEVPDSEGATHATESE